MAESRIRDDNFYLIGGWMLNRLGLKGTALQVFAIVYGFSQDGDGTFSGSLQYLSDFTNASKPTIIKALNELVDTGLLIKDESWTNGVKSCTYKVSLPVVKKVIEGSKETLPAGGGKETLPVGKKLNGGGKETLLRGGKETLPNNIYLDNKLDKKEERGIYQRIADKYNEICISFPRLQKLSEGRKKALRARLNTYTVENFETVFHKAEASSFLKGKNDRNWSATFDWMVKDSNMAKILDGNFDDKGGLSNEGHGADPAADRGKGKPQYGTVL